MQMIGTVAFNSASGRGEIIDGKEFLFVLVDSRVSRVRMYLWIWDDENETMDGTTGRRTRISV